MTDRNPDDFDTEDIDHEAEDPDHDPEPLSDEEEIAVAPEPEDK